MSSMTFANTVTLSASSDLFHSILKYHSTVSVLAMISILVMEHKEVLYYESYFKFLLGFISWRYFLLNSYLTHFQLLAYKKINCNGWFNTIYWVLSDLYCVNFTKSCLTLKPLALIFETPYGDRWGRIDGSRAFPSSRNLPKWRGRKDKALNFMHVVIWIGSQKRSIVKATKGKPETKLP